MARRLLSTLLLALTGVLGLLPTATAAPSPSRSSSPADDQYPSTEDIARARAEADARAADTAAIESRLTAAQAELEQSGRLAEQAVEAYNGTQARLAKARTEAAAAAQRAAVAAAERAEAADRAAQLAAETYRQGGSAELSAINALLGASGPRAVSDQAAAVRMAGTRTKQILDAATSTSAEATRTSAKARAAEQDAQRAAQAVRVAKEQAQARVAAQQTQVAEIGKRREQLLAELAAARDTTLELERQRREALEAEAAQQAEAAARAAAAAAPVDPGGSTSAPPASADGVEAALTFAHARIGLPYIWGGEGPEGYDCSGLTMMAWRQGGKNLTHFAADQYAESTPVSYRNLRPGDLVFWTHTGRAADIYHVAIYLGGDQMIEAPRPGTAIKQASLWIMGRPDFYARP